MPNLRVGARINLLVGLPLIVIIALVTVSVTQFSKINNGVERIYDDNVVPLMLLKKISDSYKTIVDSINKADNALVLPNEALEAIEEARAAIDKNWNEYQIKQHKNANPKITQEANELFARADSGVKEAVEVLRSMGTELRWNEFGETLISDYNGDLYDLIDPIALKISDLTAIKVEAAEQERRRSADILANVKASFIAIAIASIVLLSLAGWLMGRSIVEPLTVLKNSIKKAEREKNLKVEIDINPKNEIGEVGLAYKLMMDRFSKILQNIQSAFDELQSNTSSLAGSTITATNYIQEQLRDTDLVANAAKSMSSSVQEVSDGANRAVDATCEADQGSQEGIKILESTIEAINRLAGRVDGVSKDINRVAEDSDSIGSILDVIRGIADQTNLLALNAAIEAARAGEQGRGFAVVADEVRSLAQRTQESTQEIQSMIERLQTGTKEAVLNMEAGSVDMLATKDKASKAKSSLTEIAAAVSLINNMNQHIAKATNENMKSTSSIANYTENIATICKKSHRSAENVDDIGKKINGVASELNSILAEFKY